MTSNSFTAAMEQQQYLVNQFLNEQTRSYFTPDLPLSKQLSDALHYAVMNGGKRIRPLLVIASAQTINPDISIESLNHIAAAVEYIHCYSLVHDDLPAMDDDDMRRGKPTCHKKYDEATAILVGDALQAESYQLLLKSTFSDSIKIKLINELSLSSGMQGLVTGQAIDLAATNKKIDINELQDMHLLKTGALIRTSVKLGAIAAEASTEQLNNLDKFAKSIGLAFQVLDDILDIESSTEILGKTQGSDHSKNKSTYPSLLGMDEAKQHLQALSKEAIETLSPFKQRGQYLHNLALFIIERKH